MQVGAIIGETIVANVNVPPFAKSPFDGYALIAADTPGTLRVVGTTVAEDGGSVTGQDLRVTPGTAVKVFTGAPVPPGADCVVKYEWTTFTDTTVTLDNAVEPGNIIPQGEDVKAGDIIARRGDVLTPALIGVLAAQGIMEPRIQAQRQDSLSNGQLVRAGTPVQVGIISSGNELGKSIRDVNRYVLQAAVEECGASAVFLGTATDEADSIPALIRDAACDMYISTGGMGQSERDFTLSGFEAAGARVLRHNGDFTPGGTFALAELVRRAPVTIPGFSGQPVFMLSGNPAAALVTFYVLIAPILRGSDAKRVMVTFAQPYPKSNPRTRYVVGRLDSNGAFTPMERGKGTISAFVGANALAIVPKGSPPPTVGTKLEAVLL